MSVIYTVVKDDTLIGIARKYPGISWTNIRDANTTLLRNNYNRFKVGDFRRNMTRFPLGWWIFPGDRLVIPITVSTPAPATPTAPAPTPPPREQKPKPEKEKRIQVDKYEYALGLYNTEIRETRYAPVGIYVSKPFQVDGNAIELSLDAIENHPVFDTLGRVSDRQTSIEYYITYSNNPTTIEWLPILPTEQKKIRNELLIFKNRPDAKLRFKARSNMPISVYENGNLMSNSSWFIKPDYKHIQINSDRFMDNKTYTIDYVPDSNHRDPWNINFIKEGLSPTPAYEIFENGTSRNAILYLDKQPYIDYSKINDTEYSPVKVTLFDANIKGPGRTAYDIVSPSGTEAFTKNVTDYQSDIQPLLRQYDPKIGEDSNPTYLGFEFLHSNNKLYFTETFYNSHIVDNMTISHGNAKIKVDYELLTPSIRIKIILRNTSELGTVSPVVSSYTLKFHVVR